MTAQHTDNWKKAGVIVAILMAFTAYGRYMVGDRFGVESRMTRIEVKVDNLSDTVKMIADQRIRIAGVEADLNQIKARLDRYETRLNGLEDGR